jgi:hypothetical protein
VGLQSACPVRSSPALTSCSGLTPARSRRTSKLSYRRSGGPGLRGARRTGARYRGNAAVIAVAEEAVARRVTGLLLNVPRERVLVGRTIEIYRWLDLTHWERAAARLEALWRKAPVVLGRAYRDGGCYDAAMVLYGQLLGEAPHDRRVQEGLLLAARGAGDRAQVTQVWQQICACVDGDTDIELRSMYERLMTETRGPGAINGRSGVAPRRSVGLGCTGASHAVPTR